MSNRIKPFIYFIAIVLFIVYILFGTNPRSTRIEYLNKIRVEIVKGKIVAKYIDSNNHNYKIIKILNYDNKEIVWFMNYDTSSFFEEVVIGDSIIKRKDTVKVMIIRDSIKKEYILDFQTK